MTFGQSSGFEGDEFCHSDGERVVFWVCDKICGYIGVFCEKKCGFSLNLGPFRGVELHFSHKKAYNSSMSIAIYFL